MHRFMRHTPSMARRMSGAGTRHLFNQSMPRHLPVDAYEEEENTDHHADHHYQLHPGAILHKRYEIISKLGCGRVSTVWLAHDTARWFWQRPRYVSVKVCTSDVSGHSSASREREIGERILKHSSHSASTLLRPHLEAFHVDCMDGSIHQCMVYEPMREPMSIFRRRWQEGKVPVAFVRAYVILLLRALDFLHTECRVVHTDLKEDNILMTFEDGAVLEDFVKALGKQSVTAEAIGNHDLNTTTADFGSLRSLRLLPTLTDFGLSEILDGDCTSRRAIQPPAYHAPEVLLGIPWSYPADIWNLGVLIWNLMEGKDLFADLNTNNGTYHPRLHLAQMVGFLGKPPKQLLDREREWRHVPYDERGIDGEIITPCESFGGPFFDEEGRFIFADLSTTQRRLSDTVTALEGDEKRSFLDLISRMLRWVPEERESAKELLEHSWLQQEE